MNLSKSDCQWQDPERGKRFWVTRNPMFRIVALHFQWRGWVITIGFQPPVFFRRHWHEDERFEEPDITF